MKRHGNLYSRIIDKGNLYDAYLKARRGKRWQRVVQGFEKDLDGNLERLRKCLKTKTFTTSEYKEKIIREPKVRTIYILPFYPDRIVQHALVQVVGPIWDGLFIYDSYACRVGKGMHKGSRRTMQFLRRNKYALKADISKFYPSIDHEVLIRIIRRKIKCRDTLWLIENIICSQSGGKNVPIGNYTSQWFGNLYLNELDQWVKHDWKVRDYLRYCDDFVLFHDDKRFLHEIKDAIELFLEEVLKLKFSRWGIFPVVQGVDFLGYRHFRDYILLRKATMKRVKKRLLKLPGMLEKGEITMEQFRSSVESTKGWLRWANTYNLAISLKITELEKLYEKV